MEAHFKILLFSTFLFVTQSLPWLSNRTELRALIELRASLGISAKDWHKKVNPCLNWTGIVCKNGHITGINLSGLRRTNEGNRNPRFDIGSLPSFTYLSSFNSSGFLLQGPIPEWLGQRLSNLEVLDLRSSSIYGSIPSSIGGLRRLSVLCLSNNSVTGNMPTALGNLTSLLVLDVSQNLLTGQIPREVSSLVNLSELDFSSNFLSGGIPVEFGLLSRLELLNLSNNSLSGSIPARLGNLSRLVELDLGYNSLVGLLPKELGGLRNLRKMLIANNLLEGPFLDGLFQNLTHLDYLDVSRNNLAGVLSDVMTYSNVTSAVLNFSNNLFYGNLNLRIGNFRIIDLSSNYFEGSAPNDSRISIIISNNCFSRLPAQRNIEACRSFYSDRGLYFGNDNSLEPLEPQRGRKRLAYVMVGVFGGLGFIIVLTGAFFLLLKTCNIRNTNHQRQNPNVGSAGIEPPSKVFVDLPNLGESFTYEQMLLATCNFSTENLIKQGHSGDLFKGTLEGGGPTVVVKRVDLRSVRNESFKVELDLFGRVMHRRLVPLVGHCLEDEYEKFLVYKYMQNGDLSNALYRVWDGEEDLQSLDWITRLKIAIGAAEALSYLHHDCTPPIVHRDIQASTILLDDKYEVRLGSFSDVCAPGANSQNMIARLLRTPQSSGRRSSGPSSNTCAYDVYCFGKVLLELVTGKLGISSLSDTGAKQWLDTNLPFISIHDKELVTKIVDQSLIIDEDLLEEVWAVAIVAKSCLNPKASRRPSMRHVLKALENPFKVVRNESFSFERLRAASSRQSWTAAIFGSWHQSSSGSSNTSSQKKREIITGPRQAERVGSRGSGAHEYSSSHKRSLSDVFPEPVDMQDVES